MSDTISRSAPIGVFDSGLGGLTVVREMLRRLPHERLIYVGDTAHVPYGGRDLGEIREFAIEISRFLIEDAGCKAVVMACNISSAVAYEAVQARWPEIPVLGVIKAGARAAAEMSGGGPIAVLATEGTVRSGAYARAIAAESPGARVTSVPCPLFVPLVESGQSETPAAAEAARDYLAQAFAPDHARIVILGCTHYPFLLPVLTKAAGPGVAFVDPAGETVRELSCLLVREGLEAVRLAPNDGGAHFFYATGSAEAFAAGARAFLGDVAAQPCSLCWTEERTLTHHAGR